MYGKATSMEHCTGIGLRWTFDETIGKLRPSHFYDYAREELEWLSWYEYETGRHVKHKWNTGRTINIHGKYPDGYVPATKTCLFFDGCYWHGHSCALTKHSTKPPEYWKGSQKDFAIRSYLARRGYNIVEMKECQWRDRQLHGGFPWL